MSGSSQKFFTFLFSHPCVIAKSGDILSYNTCHFFKNCLFFWFCKPVCPSCRFHATSWPILFSSMYKIQILCWFSTQPLNIIPLSQGTPHKLLRSTHCSLQSLYSHKSGSFVFCSRDEQTARPFSFRTIVFNPQIWNKFSQVRPRLGPSQTLEIHHLKNISKTSG